MVDALDLGSSFIAEWGFKSLRVHQVLAFAEAFKLRINLLQQQFLKLEL